MSDETKYKNWLILSKNDSSNHLKLNNKRKNTKHIKVSQNLKLKKEMTELTMSPISGTYIIKKWKKKQSKSNAQKFTQDEVELNSIAASFVKITAETRAKLEAIPNHIGPYECKLCATVFKDAFELAMHNCPRVVNIEYKCSECDKVFNCPANLASHKRWHQPNFLINKKNSLSKSNDQKDQKTKEPTTQWNQFMLGQSYLANNVNANSSFKVENELFDQIYSLTCLANMPKSFSINEP